MFTLFFLLLFNFKCFIGDTSYIAVGSNCSFFIFFKPLTCLYISFVIISIELEDDVSF